MADGSSVRVTCSLGLSLHPRDGRSGKALLRAADAAMYAHKRSRSTTDKRTDRRESVSMTVAPEQGPAELKIPSGPNIPA